MGMYDFNTPRYNVDAVIDALRKELRDIAVDNETDIAEIKRRIAQDEKLLVQLKKAVDELPDYTEQYNEISVELDDVKEKVRMMYEHPVVLDMKPMDIEYIVIGGASDAVGSIQD